MRIREFNKEGLIEWKRRYDLAVAEQRNTFDIDFLQDPRYSYELSLDKNIENLNFKTRLGHIGYLTKALETRQNRHLYYRKSFWIWLSAFYFDTVTERDRKGKLKVKKIQWYYSGDPGGTGRLNRGALDFACKIYDNSPEFAVVALTGPPYRSNDLYDRLGDQREFMLNRSLMCVLHQLFHNTEERNRSKARRFFKFLRQVSLTTDVEALTVEEIMEIIPEDLTEHLK